MDFETSLTILRTLSIIVAGVLGIIGLLGKFRKKNGKLNKWGHGAIFVIAISTVISISTTIIEGKKEKAETVEQLSRMEGLLQQLNRVGHPITELEVTFWVELSTADKIVEKYIEELDQVIGFNRKSLQAVFPKVEGLDLAATDQNGDFLAVHVNQKSPFWPKGDKKIIGDIARTFGFAIYIRRDPINPELFHPMISIGPNYSDWIAYGVLLQTNNVISMNYRDKKVYIFGSQHYDKKFWKTNGKIMSIPDLYGAQLFLLPPHTFDHTIPEKYKAFVNPSIRPLIGLMNVKTVALKFSSGHEIWIDGAKLSKTKFRGGYPVFSITLPKNEKELLALASHES